MNRCFIILLVTLLLSSCNTSNSNVDMIKKSTILDFPGMYLGDMLDNYKFFTETEWSEFSTPQGEDIVQFVGRYINTEDSIFEDYYPERKNFIDVRKGYITIQFTIYKQEMDDGTNFEIAYVGTKRDSAEYNSTSESEQWSIISKISNNKPLDIY